MKEVLLYGDSNTYGYRDEFGGRFSAEQRWPMRAAALLGPEYQLQEAGLNGRTAGPYPGLPAEKDGLLGIQPYLQQPWELIVVMLGTNDVGYAAVEVVLARLRELLNHILAQPQQQEAQLLLLAPVPMTTLADPPQLSHQLAASYQALAAELNIAFADAGLWGVELIEDGCHISAAGQETFAQQIAPRIAQLCK